MEIPDAVYCVKVVVVLVTRASVRFLKKEPVNPRPFYLWDGLILWKVSPSFFFAVIQPPPLYPSTLFNSRHPLAENLDKFQQRITIVPEITADPPTFIQHAQNHITGL